MSRCTSFSLSLHTLAFVWLSLLSCTVAQKPPTTWTSAPFDPPAIPLMVRSPFSTTWLANGNGTALYDSWASHWNGARIGMSSSVRVDGASYRVVGEDNASTQSARQTSMQFTATSTIFTFRCGAVDFTYTFVSPVDPSDLVRFSFPWSYLVISASSNDGAAHKVEVYADVSGEWINDDPDTPIQWKTRMVDAQGGKDDALVTHQVWQTTGVNCTQTDSNRIQDGTMYLSTFNHPGLTFATVPSTRARQGFWDTGKLENQLDRTFRNVGAQWPVFGFAHDLGSVLGASRPVIFGLGQSRENLVQYATGANGQSQYRAPFYLTQFPSTEAAMDFFMRDYAQALSVASAVDAQVEADGKGVSDNYAGLLQLAFRQAVAGLELTAGRTSSGAVDANDVMMFVAEIGTQGKRFRTNVVDQIYIMMPFFLYIKPALLKYALRPTLQYHKAGLATSRYCVHNIGIKYPQATGTGGELEMPVGASAGMILLAAAHLQRTGDKSIVNEYYDVLKQFADYLVDTTLSPASQPTISETWIVDATAQSANLAVQGILALRAMADISNAHGDTANQDKYKSTAQEFMSQWQELAMSSDDKHLVFQYGDDKTYTIMHNMYPDRLLGFNLIPKDIYTIQEAWYEEMRSDYGPAILWKRGWTFTGPSLWAAATMERPTMRNQFIDSTVKQLQSGLTDVPMPDHFDGHFLSAYDGFRARPHVGSHFSLLALQNKTINTTAAAIDDPAPNDDPEDAAPTLPHRTFNIFILAFTLFAWISVF